MEISFTDNEQCSQLGVVDVTLTYIVEFLGELDESKRGGDFRIKVETHCLPSRCWVVAVHVTV